MRLETDSCACYVQVLLRLFSETDAAKVQLAEARLISVATAVLRALATPVDDLAYLLPLSSLQLSLTRDRIFRPEAQINAAARVPVGQLLLRGLLQWRPAQLNQHLSTLYPLLVDLIMASSRDLRAPLRELFQMLRPTLTLASNTAAVAAPPPALVPSFNASLSSPAVSLSTSTSSVPTSAPSSPAPATHISQSTAATTPGSPLVQHQQAAEQPINLNASFSEAAVPAASAADA